MIKKFLLAALLSLAFAAPALAQAAVGGPFSLTTHTGQRVTDATYKGKYLIVYFGFTSCPDVCPLGLKKLTAAVDGLGPMADKVQPVFITIDPSRDTPARLATYLRSYSPRITGLTGTQAEIDAVVKAYKMFVHKQTDPQQPDGYTFYHMDYIFVMNPQGGFYSLLQGASTAEQLAYQLKAIIK